MFVNFPLASFLFPLRSETIKEPIKETTSRLFPPQPLPFTIDLKLLLSYEIHNKNCINIFAEKGFLDKDFLPFSVKLSSNNCCLMIWK